MIRQVKTQEEVLQVATFMKQFEQATEYVKVDPEHAARTYWPFIEKGIAVFLILEDAGQMVGGLGAIKHPDLHDGKLTAVETFWFVDPAHRGKGLQLFKAFEEWGISQGCTKLAMIHLADSYPDALERLYIRKGYKLVEKHFVKEVTP